MNKKRYDRGLSICILVAVLGITYLVAETVTTLSLCGSFYVHEGGHIVYGSLDNILQGRTSTFSIVNWESCPRYTFIPIPQSTQISEGVSWNFILGGIVSVILVTSAIAYYLWKRTKRKIYWMYPLLFAFHEIVGNFLCGTDNLQGKGRVFCQNNIFHNWIYIFIFGMILVTMIIVYPKVKSIINRLEKKYLRNHKVTT